MTFDELVVHDFGVYRGRQEILLTPPSSEKPIILFGGLNGGGKTTLLDAIQLCLYGAHARCSNRQGLAYNEYLKRSIHHGAKAGEAAVALQFRHMMEGVEQTYRLQRSWRVSGKGVRENFEVRRNGILDRAATENWREQVDDFMPVNIAHLFFFDGEKVELYADADSATRLIESAIHGLLGLDTVERLCSDLRIFDRRKVARSVDPNLEGRIESLEQDLRVLQDTRSRRRQERATKESLIGSLANRLETAEETFRKLGGELYEQRSEIEAKRTAAKDACTSGALALREIAAGGLPLILVRDCLEAIEKRDLAEQETWKNHELGTILEDRDRDALEVVGRSEDSSAVAIHLKRFFDEDRAARRRIGSEAMHLELSTVARRDLAFLLQDQLSKFVAEAREALENQQQLDEQLEHWELELASVPQLDTIQAALEERDNLRARLERERGESEALDLETERLDREVAAKQRDIDSLHYELAERSNEEEDRKRLLRHSERVQATLERFRKAVVASRVERIEELVLDSYRMLLRKASLAHQLRIDTSRFSLTLFGPDSRPVLPERLSAGERQLLAVALLWGLARASGRPLPTAIDTPLGRLDADHRSHLVERYFPYASHQTLLFSTDEEISGRYFSQIEPWVGRCYELVFDDSTGASQVQPGYFRQDEVA